MRRCSDNWTTYAHDEQRTGFEAQQTGLSSGTVSHLALRWKISLPQGGYAPTDPTIYSSLVAYRGLVLIATSYGTLYALNAKNGAILWKSQLGGQVIATPTIENGVAFLGNRYFNGIQSVSGRLFAIDLLTGAPRWYVNLPGIVHGSTIEYGDTVVIGAAGGDPPYCVQRGLFAFDQTTGQKRWTWFIDPLHAHNGGGVWSDFSVEGGEIYAGTGNTCTVKMPTSNAVVAVSAASGTLNWELLEQQNSILDDDQGGGELVSQNAVYAINKNGSLYAMDQ